MQKKLLYSQRYSVVFVMPKANNCTDTSKRKYSNKDILNYLSYNILNTTT